MSSRKQPMKIFCYKRKLKNGSPINILKMDSIIQQSDFFSTLPKPWLLDYQNEIMQEVLKMENIQTLWNKKE
jgi:hypothetical protein